MISSHIARPVDTATPQGSFERRGVCFCMNAPFNTKKMDKSAVSFDENALAWVLVIQALTVLNLTPSCCQHSLNNPAYLDVVSSYETSLTLSAYSLCLCIRTRRYLDRLFDAPRFCGARAVHMFDIDGISMLTSGWVCSLPSLKQ